MLGSLIALMFVKTGWPRKVAYFLAGWGLSKIFGEAVQGVIGTSLEAARAVVALFGLALIEKGFDILGNFDTTKATTDLWNAVLRLVGGAPKE